MGNMTFSKEDREFVTKTVGDMIKKHRRNWWFVWWAGFSIGCGVSFGAKLIREMISG